jgi:PKD domain-containing protein
MKARILAVAISLVLLCGGTPVRAVETPALFRVGVAVRDITPCVGCPQYLGGFGYGDPVDGSGAHDPLQVRAMAVSRGKHMVLFAIVDSQGYFSGNQEGPWGSQKARSKAAAKIAKLGYNVGQGNIIVSSTHSHAAPTIMGIWGTTDPAYLKTVFQATVAALVDAASHLRNAYLYYGTGDISTVTISNVTQTDGYQGWRPDGETPVLWARDPSTGATIGLYANVPTHADIVNGVGHHTISADHIGVERDALDAALGGRSVVAMGTLGRQETIVQVGGINQAENVGRYVTNEIERALKNAKPITSGVLRAAETYLLVPATNPALLALDAANMVADPAGKVTGDPIATHCVPGVDICTIDRSILPPYAVGDAFGTWFNAFRIGDVVWATEPGEAFPEVSTSIRTVFGGPKVNIVGMAQDQLGYYYPPETYPWTFVNDSDHHLYNSSLLLGEFNVYAHALNAVKLGFTPSPNHETNQIDNLDALQRVGVQFFPIPREQAATTFVFDVKWSESVLGALTMGILGAAESPTEIVWDWGDGSAAQTTGQGLIPHTFPGPGTYTVTASVNGSTGPSSWTQNVIVDPPLSASVATAGGTVTVTTSGGAGAALAAHWLFDNGATAHGISVPLPAGASGGSVTVVDAAGNTLSLTF